MRGISGFLTEISSRTIGFAVDRPGGAHDSSILDTENSAFGGTLFSISIPVIR